MGMGKGWIGGADKGTMDGRRVATDPVTVGEIGCQSDLLSAHQFLSSRNVQRCAPSQVLVRPPRLPSIVIS